MEGKNFPYPGKMDGQAGWVVKAQGVQNDHFKRGGERACRRVGFSDYQEGDRLPTLIIWFNVQ
jgi:hypothetical protein